MGDPTPAPTLAVLIPFRDSDPRQNRRAQLEEWVRRAPGILDAAWGRETWVALVMQQPLGDGHKFSRGRVLNAGAAVVAAKWPSVQVLLLHDVDLCMDVDRARAAMVPPLHEGEVRALNSDSPDYSGCVGYVGGVCAVRVADFRAVNGFWNSFEGWGGEDDCLRNAFRLLFRTAFEITQPLSGHMDAVGPVPYRCAADADAKMPIADRRRAKDEAHSRVYSGNGLAELCFRTTAPNPDRALERLQRCVFRMEVDVFPGSLIPPWRMAISGRLGVPYYVNPAKRVSTYVWPRE